MSEAASALEAEIRRRIEIAGPIPVGQYMMLCLSHPTLGYYTTRDPFGASGDFTTAPEISQMFGELLGLWAAAVWHQMGSPEDVRLIELGPGRGTLMRDALRAVKVAPDFRDALAVHLVEISPALQQRQQHTLSDAGVPIQWHRTLDAVPAGPAIVIANELFDALPVQQMVKQADGWHERVVGLDAVGKLIFALAPDPLRNFERLLPQAAPDGAVFEWRSDQPVLELGRRLVRSQGVALIIDYGHTETAAGDTLQAVRGHGYADPLAAPGQVDLTAHVDFQALARAAESIGARVHGPVTQAALLRRLGIAARAAALKSAAGREQAAAIDAALARLTSEEPTGMGRLFKAVGLSHPAIAMLPGFES